MISFQAIAMRAALACLCVALAASAQPQPGMPGKPPPQPGQQPGPWDQDVEVYRAGRDGRMEKLATFERAGVPTAARLADGRLVAAFQHFPSDDQRNFDRVAVRFSTDEGRIWGAAQAVSVEGMEPGMARPFDPTLVPLPDGRVRLYFTSNRSPDFERSPPAIYSAISPDGVRYQFEPGVRFAIPGRLVIDCAVALHESVFHLIVPDNGTAQEMRERRQRREPPRGGTGYHAVSRDGLHFERVADVINPSGDHWLGNLQSDGGRLVFFGTGRGGWPLASRDGANWRPDEPSFGIPGADPGAVRLRDGSWLLVVTSPPRPGTPSATRRAPR